MSGEEERKKLVGRGGIVGAGTLLSRILGFGRDVVIAALFTRMQTDVFAAALTIPNALRQLLAEGAVSRASCSRTSSSWAPPRSEWRR